MKYLLTFYILLFLSILGSTEHTVAQAPERMTYQAVIRNTTNKLVTNTSIGIQISILQGSVYGQAVYVERHFPTTNSNGLITLEIGDGTVVKGSMSEIDWSDGPYYLKTETDLKGGASYTISGTSQLMSVPYALHAKTAERLLGQASESDPVFSSSDAALINENDVSNIKNLSGTNTGDQDISNLATKTELSDSTQMLLGNIPDVSGFITAESDPDYHAWDKDYNDLINTPESWDSTYASIKNKPNLSIYATKNMSNGRITNLGNPVNDKDAVNKAYVDAILKQLSDKGLIVSDVDGNVYSTVRIGPQIWMAENLKTTKLNDGTEITQATDNAEWGALTGPGCCWYDNDKNTNEPLFGPLYNWYTVESGKICPEGWHVPSDAEWTTLATFLGGESIAAGKLKDAGTSLWIAPNAAATNEYGFSVRPGGYRNYTGAFGSINYYGYLWSATENNTTTAWYRSLYYNSGNMVRNSIDKKTGYSIRCVKDE
ncbi:fibrobacter succinogenes major paralogous domain-containing protein [Saccharicrinis sp. FJH2]|uniref:fibrobacter succinogenes major paralogous domain-containing protein n=1 Tax=Saccharicrinis sp. FJH65 TaxID=3344659 RepID=UPI0035F2D11F